MLSEQHDFFKGNPHSLLSHSWAAVYFVFIRSFFFIWKYRLEKRDVCYVQQISNEVKLIRVWFRMTSYSHCLPTVTSSIRHHFLHSFAYFATSLAVIVNINWNVKNHSSSRSMNTANQQADSWKSINNLALRWLPSSLNRALDRSAKNSKIVCWDLHS